MEYIEDKMFEFYFSTVPKWPGNKINMDKFKEEEDLEIYEREYESKLSFNMTITEMQKELGMSRSGVKAVIKRASKKLDTHMQLFFKLKNMMLQGESIDNVHLKTLAAEIKSDRFSQDVLYLKETTNFFNPNIGAGTWQFIKSLSQI
jgi:hypothetical protein